MNTGGKLITEILYLSNELNKNKPILSYLTENDRFNRELWKYIQGNRKGESLLKIDKIEFDCNLHFPEDISGNYSTESYHLEGNISLQNENSKFVEYTFEIDKPVKFILCNNRKTGDRTIVSNCALYIPNDSTLSMMKN